MNRSKAIRNIILLSSCILVGIIVRQISSKYMIPELKLESDLMELGTVELGSQTEFYLKFNNSGRGKLIIENISVSCDCTAVDWEDIGSIKRNEIDSILIRFDAQSVGHQLLKISIQTNSFVALGNYYIKASVIN